MKLINKILLLAKNLFFPAACALCETELIELNEIQYGLCCNCASSAVPSNGEKCTVCGKPLISEIGTCLPCRNNPNHSFDRLWVLFPYTGRYRKLLTAYKFHKNLSLAEFFAEKIEQILVNEPLLADSAIVPVPPRPGKIKHSGWDQVEHLVKKVKKRLVGRSVSRCLKRSKSRVQKSLTRTERLDNLKGRITAAANVPQNAVIIDDVMTTGSTMEICAQALKNSGAKRVYGICLFYD